MQQIGRCLPGRIYRLILTDESNTGLGAILSKGPIVHISRTLNDLDLEIKYSTIENECMEISLRL